MNSEVEDKARKILEQIDQPEPVRTCGELVGVIAEAVNSTGSFTNDVGQRLRPDWMACGIVTRALIAYPQAPETPGQVLPRVTGSGVYSDGSVHPDPSKFTPEDLAYFTQRAEETHNPVLKARYHHLVFDQTRRNRRSIAQAAIDAYLESARLFANSARKHADLDAVVEIDQAVGLALEVQERERLRMLVEFITERLRVEPESRQSHDGKPLPVGRFLYDLANIIIYIAEHGRLGNAVSAEHLELIEQRMDAMSKQNAIAGMHLLNYQLLRAAQKAATLRHDTSKAYQLSTDRIEALVAQAQSPFTDNAIAALTSAKHYEDAVIQYEKLRGAAETSAEQRASIDSRINELRLSLKAAYREAREKQVYKNISAEVEIDTEERDTFFNELLTGDNLFECLDNIVSEGSLLPNVASAKEEAEQARKDAPLLAMIARTQVADDIPVAHAAGEDERLAQDRDRNLIYWIQINTDAVLIPLIERLETDRGLNADILATYFEQWGLASEQDIEFLRLGFQHYFADDHASALHILVPRYEALLRGAFETGGTAAFRSRRTQPGSEAETLGAFLSKPAVADTLSEDLRAYIRLVLTEQHGWNLRNRIAHGLARLQECTSLESTVVIHLLLLLTLMQVNAETIGDIS